jgi:hypothetical protein
MRTPSMIVGGGLVLVAAASAVGRPGPTSPLYIKAGFTRYYKVQGDQILTSWPLAAYDASFVVRDTVRATSTRFDFDGAEYTLDGELIRTGFAVCYDISPSIYPLDGAADGTHNYAFAPSGGGVYRFDAEWQACELFSTTMTGGLAYDATDGTFWTAVALSEPSRRAEIRHYSAGGTLLTTFLLNSGLMRIVDPAIALDPADGTLWVVGRTTDTLQGQLRQYSKVGQFLGAQTYAGLPLSQDDDQIAAMEFQFHIGCRADFDGSGGADVRDFLAFLAAYAAADPRADFDGSGAIDVADFLAFLGAYAVGC